MKVKALIAGVVALGLTGAVFAAGNYLPPERIHCTLNAAKKMQCSDFNRYYLTENTSTAALEAGKDVVFMFSSGVAFNSGDDWAVFYTYINGHNKVAKLVTARTTIEPDLVNGAWTARGDTYICDAGYMSCPLLAPSK